MNSENDQIEITLDPVADMGLIDGPPKRKAGRPKKYQTQEERAEATRIGNRMRQRKLRARRAAELEAAEQAERAKIVADTDAAIEEVTKYIEREHGSIDNIVKSEGDIANVVYQDDSYNYVVFIARRPE